MTVQGRADLLEQAREHPDPQQLHGYEIATVTARLDVERLGVAGPLAPDAETAQPLYARYWLHNRGPAPLGGMPVTPALHPHRLDADPGARLSLDLTVASDSVDAELAGAVTLACPAGWDAAPAAHPVQLGAGEHVCRPLAVTVPADAAPGSIRSVPASTSPATFRRPGASRSKTSRWCVSAIPALTGCCTSTGPARSR